MFTFNIPSNFFNYHLVFWNRRATIQTLEACYFLKSLMNFFIFFLFFFNCWITLGLFQLYLILATQPSQKLRRIVIALNSNELRWSKITDDFFCFNLLHSEREFDSGEESPIFHLVRYMTLIIGKLQCSAGSAHWK